MTQPTAKTLDRLAAVAETADSLTDWPAESWQAVQAAGALGWSVPAEYDGAGLGPQELLAGHERIASACLTTAFILSQREAAIRQLLKGTPRLRERFLPDLLAGRYATVGLSQLTTSRQHGGPSALRATPTADGWTLDGIIPWVTGADQAAVIVAGATLAEGSQVLIALPPDRPGVRVEPPMSLASLIGSRTAAVRCHGVEIERDLLLAGPAERVLGPVGGGGLETTNLALGLAVAATDLIEQEAATRPDLLPVATRFRTAANEMRSRLHTLAVTKDADATLAIRVSGTLLALRATQAALLTSKGAGFVNPHPAGRLARQAHFFLVWSCPRPVASGVLDDLQYWDFE